MPQGPGLALFTRRGAVARGHAIWLPLLIVLASVGIPACGDDDGGDGGNGEAAGSGETTPAEEEGPTLDTARVESELKRTLDGQELLAAPATIYPEEGGAPEQGQIGGGRINVRSVSCPEDIPVERGGTFTCDVESRRTPGTVRLRQLNDAGTSLKYTATLESSGEGGLPVETKTTGRLSLD